MSVLTETEIGTIAPDWKVEPLERVCEPPQYGYTASAEDKGNVRFLRITDITESGVEWPTVPFCECPAELLNKYRLASGDIVFARIGATTGKSYLITNPPPSVFASYLIRVRAKKEIDPSFLSQFFRSVAYWRQVDAQKNANLKKGVSGSLLKTLVVPVPPLAEQRKIAGVVGLVQRALEQQERLIALITELKKALLHQLFTQGLRGEPQKQTEIGPVPESWEVRPCEELCEMITVGVVVKPASHYVESGVPAFRSMNVREDRLEVTELVFFSQETNDTILAKSKLRTGDVLIVRTGYPGTSCVVPEEYDGANCIDLVIARPRLKVIQSGFLSRFFNSDAGKR
jgi:type I restriction enzyme S subunit